MAWYAMLSRGCSPLCVVGAEQGCLTMPRGGLSYMRGYTTCQHIIYHILLTAAMSARAQCARAPLPESVFVDVGMTESYNEIVLACT
jgi:hypothetical protein